MTHQGMAYIDSTYDATHKAPPHYRYTICQQLVPTMLLLAPGPTTCNACQAGHTTYIATMTRGLTLLGKQDKEIPHA
jgi:hypothetical protein